ncbi:MAG: cation:proton antiporter, partial [Dehalococcoidia bacterium]|nr:cation:proton antiporter [Dehalococcoidia bacterium]
MTADLLNTSLALIGVVIIIAALLSGLIERSGIPQVALFLALGAALGPFGLNLVSVTIDSPALRTVATLSLALVLFIDAVTLNLPEVRQHAGLATRMIVLGAVLSAATVAFAAWALLGVSIPAAIMLGAALSSIDPVLLRGLLKWDALPPSARLGLRLESGLNDIALVPLLLVALSVEALGDLTRVDWGQLLLDLFILGPGAGVAVGVVAVSALEMVRSRIGVRRDYESIYSLGVAFTAFAAAEAVGGSGFLAAFAAGLTISALDVELCDCFVEYGETTAEMALLLTFVLFGASLIWTGFTVIAPATLAFAVIALVSRV